MDEQAAHEEWAEGLTEVRAKVLTLSIRARKSVIEQNPNNVALRRRLTREIKTIEAEIQRRKDS